MEYAFGAIATAEQCIRLGKILRSIYKDFKSAEREISELIVELEHHSLKIEHQVELLKKAWDSLDDGLQILQNHLLHVLSRKLQEATELADGAIGRKREEETEPINLKGVKSKKGSVRKFKYALSLKDSLVKSLAEISRWQQMFDPTWFLMSRITSEAVDQTLKQFSDANLKSNSDARSVLALKRLRHAISDGQSKPSGQHAPNVSIVEKLEPGSLPSTFDQPISLARLRNGDQVIVSTFVPDRRAAIDRVREDMENLHRVLSQVDPLLFGLMKSLGFIERVVSATPGDTHGVFPGKGIGNARSTTSSTAYNDTNPPQPVFHLILRIPDELETPVTLRSLLTSQSAPSLNGKLSLAQSLSNAILFVHASSFVHKNVRPETIICFKSPNTKNPMPFLAGFEKFRQATAASYLIGDTNWERDLYRHPGRQGMWLENSYVMQHDVYSLGVVLLEIGLWTSFVVSKANGDLSVGPELPIASFLEEKSQTSRASKIKGAFVDLATSRLPLTMGEKYSKVVISCLTCLDAGNDGFGDPADFLTRDGVAIGVRYAEKVILNLQQIIL